MLDAVAAAAVEVAFAAVIARGRAHGLCRGQQVGPLGGIAIFAFGIRGRVRVAGEAVHVFGIVEIVVGIRPAVAGVAGHALLFVALRADAEVVDLVGLADGDRLVAPGNVKRLALPREVGGSHHFSGGVRVAFQAGLGHFLPGGEIPLNNVFMVGVGDVAGHTIRGGVFRLGGLRPEYRQGDDDDQ